ncbi:hypothetical protein PO124_05865 [Bacillus licheniformis]|nr:hypothetical protein [Bacillus licheniformis]
MKSESSEEARSASFCILFSFGHEVTVIARRKEQAEAIEERESAFLKTGKR